MAVTRLDEAEICDAVREEIGSETFNAWSQFIRSKVHHISQQLLAGNLDAYINGHFRAADMRIMHADRVREISTSPTEIRAQLEEESIIQRCSDAIFRQILTKVDGKQSVKIHHPRFNWPQ